MKLFMVCLHFVVTMRNGMKSFLFFAELVDRVDETWSHILTELEPDLAKVEDEG